MTETTFNVKLGKKDFISGMVQGIERPYKAWNITTREQNLTNSSRSALIGPDSTSPKELENNYWLQNECWAFLYRRRQTIFEGLCVWVHVRVLAH